MWIWVQSEAVKIGNRRIHGFIYSRMGEYKFKLQAADPYFVYGELRALSNQHGVHMYKCKPAYVFMYS